MSSSSWCNGNSQGYLHPADRFLVPFPRDQNKNRVRLFLLLFFSRTSYSCFVSILVDTWAIITFLWVPRANFETQPGKHDYITVSTLNVLFFFSICFIFYHAANKSTVTKNKTTTTNYYVH